MTASDFDLKSCLKRIGHGDIIEEELVVAILMKLMEVLYRERNLLILNSPIVICGDIHGQLDDLLQLFHESGDNRRLQYLFMGDYVDRGYHSLNTFLYLAVLKLLHPNQYYLLRGNHESRQLSMMYGFYNEIVLNYGHSGIWSLSNSVFDLLPMAALIDHEIFSVHGGLSPELPLIEMISQRNRQDEIPSSGAFCDLCWSDPEEVGSWKYNQRGAGFFFGEKEVSQFIWLNNISLITRSHQLAVEGYQYYFPCKKGEKRKSGYAKDGKLVTIWSAPNYSYRSENKASFMKYRFPDCDTYSITVFEANKTRIVPENFPVVSHYFS